MKGFLFKATLRVMAILIPIAIIQGELKEIAAIQPYWLQVLLTILLFLFAIALALAINWVAKFIPYTGSKR